MKSFAGHEAKHRRSRRDGRLSSQANDHTQSPLAGLQRVPVSSVLCSADISHDMLEVLLGNNLTYYAL